MRTFLSLVIVLLANQVLAQTEPHYTMFMYNKLLYNPAYAGSRDLTTINADYRDQWTGINGAPKTCNVTIDGTVGSYMMPFRKVALGLSLNSEQLGVEKNTDFVAYYAYRLQLGTSVLSFGLDAGAKLYAANYSALNPYQQNDPNLQHNINNAFLPNFGSGVYWSSNKYYAGFSVPNILQNYYDKNERKINNKASREIRGYYLSGGYVFSMGEHFKLEPQVMGRYAGNSDYQLPMNCDFNLSAIFYERLLIGGSYRTDKSFEAIIHMQVTKNINIGYAYDYMMSALNGYTNGSHELVVGYDIIRENIKIVTPRFIKAF